MLSETSQWKKGQFSDITCVNVVGVGVGVSGVHGGWSPKATKAYGPFASLFIRCLVLTRLKVKLLHHSIICPVASYCEHNVKSHLIYQSIFRYK